MTLRIIRLTAGALAAYSAMAACSPKDDAKKADTQVAEAPAEQAAPAPVAAPVSRIGRLPLLAEPGPTAQCHVRNLPPGAAAIVRSISYEGDIPVRNIRLGIGDAVSRDYAPINMDITSRQPGSGGVDDMESVSVIFSAKGDIQSGIRQYTASDNSSSERTGLMPEDTAAIKRLVQSLIDLCGRSRG